MIDAAFVANLAHELRTPLAIMTGYAELLRVNTSDSTREEAALRIGEASARLGDAVDDLLTIFALDSDALLIEVEPIELRGVVEQTVEDVKRRSEGHVIEIVPPGGPWPIVLADQDHLARVLRTLLMHAVKSTAEGGSVRLSAGVDGSVAAITVTDGGPGLGAEEIAAALRLPSTPAGPHRTGLELYKVRRLVELQGGTVSATNASAGGWGVSFTLPHVT